MNATRCFEYFSLDGDDCPFVLGYYVDISPGRFLIKSIAPADTHAKGRSEAVSRTLLPASCPDAVWYDSFSLNLEELRLRKDWTDVSLYGLAQDNTTRTFTTLHNRLARSLGARESLAGQVSALCCKYPVNLYVPFAEANFDDISVVITLRSGQFLTGPTSFTPCPSPRAFNGLFDDSVMPRLELASDTSTVPAGGEAIFRVRVLDSTGALLDYPMDIYLSSRSGYLPQRKLKVTGEAACRLLALGLTAGDSIRVKAGFRFFKNIIYHDFTVMETDK